MGYKSLFHGLYLGAFFAAPLSSVASCADYPNIVSNITEPYNINKYGEPNIKNVTQYLINFYGANNNVAITSSAIQFDESYRTMSFDFRVNDEKFTSFNIRLDYQMQNTDRLCHNIINILEQQEFNETSDLDNEVNKTIDNYIRTTADTNDQNYELFQFVRENIPAGDFNYFTYYDYLSNIYYQDSGISIALGSEIEQADTWKLFFQTFSFKFTLWNVANQSIFQNSETNDIDFNHWNPNEYKKYLVEYVKSINGSKDIYTMILQNEIYYSLVSITAFGSIDDCKKEVSYDLALKSDPTIIFHSTEDWITFWLSNMDQISEGVTITLNMNDDTNNKSTLTFDVADSDFENDY
jgi:hypothetical protein